MKIIFVLLFFIFSTPPAFAHVLSSDGDIGGVIHIDPEDDPLIGEVAHFNFDLKDRTGKFKAEDCNCTVTISKNEQVNHTETISSYRDTSLQMEYIFTEKGIYTIELIGEPQQENAFQKFRLSYDFRVEREGNGTTSQQSNSILQWMSTHTIHLIASVGILILVVLGGIYNRMKGKNHE